MPTPFVTVLIDTYNHERFIEQAIQSVLNQDFPKSEMEILVVDDGSTDRTPEIVREFEPRVRWIRKANGGQASALNLGISQSLGEIVAFLDGDDWWAPQKLKVVAETFQNNPDVGVVGHGYFEARTGATEVLVVPERRCRVQINDTDGVRLFHAVVGCAFTTSKQTMRRKILERILPVPESLSFAFTDFYTAILGTALSEAEVLDQPLSYYRIHGNNLWETASPSRSSSKMRMVDYFLAEMPPRLRTLGMQPELIATLLSPWTREAEGRRLSVMGGSPWSTFRHELATYSMEYRDASLGYKVYKALALGLTLVLPPSRFYQIKQWYTKKQLWRWREKIGSPVPPEPPVRTLRRPS